MMFPALLLAVAMMAAFASAAVAQDVTISLRFAYKCQTSAVPGCDAVTEQATFTTLQAPKSGPVNLTQENGGKGVLSTFWLVKKRDGGDLTIACADGSNLIFDTSKLFTQNADYFSCNKVTITGTGVNLTLSPAADGTGGVAGTLDIGKVSGGFRFMARHIDTLVSQEYTTISVPKVAIQNRWDSCILSGFRNAAPGGVANGCLMRPGANDGNPWTLESVLAGLMECRAVCMSRLPE